MRKPKRVRSTGRRRLRALLLAPLAACLLLTLAWITWTETHPEQERDLRLAVQERLETWFPDEMALPPDRLGFIPLSQPDHALERPHVLLLHGLDEPGGIWDDLAPALQQAGIEAWEFRYPNDQAIDHSADLLAEHWPQLGDDGAVVLIGHSMGGLVIREFVSRLRHPAHQTPALGGTTVRGVILIGTPNHGSEWARLRVWLGVRNLVASIPQREFSLFAALRDGTGVAKIDLRPGSRFLEDLNAREWPDAVPVRIIGGVITEPTSEMRENLNALASQAGAGDLVLRFERWLDELGEGLGDGAVPLQSLELSHAPPPVVVSASHRGMLVRTPLSDEQSEPPAIPEILAILDEWR